MDKIKDIYTQNVDKYNKLTDRTGRILLYLSLSRLIVFIAGIALMVILWKVNQVIAVGSFLAALIIFIVLLKKYSDYSFRKEYYENLEGINKDELRGLDDDYSCFKGGSEYIDPHHDFSHDIDLFGNDSLYQYLNRTCTGRGKDLLAEYLSSPSLLSNKMTERQEAIKELSGLVQWRQEFRAYGMIGDTDAALISDFNEWLREKPRYLNNKAFSVLRIFMPLLTILLLIL
ncbi:MAG TPA: hypothetical protein DEQ09_10665, partial [Bacteroidales bacterium]|nr:hypothetical protein [Bacteroidales bacterium]